MNAAELLHKYMREHVEAHFPGFDVDVATNPAEQWVAVLWHQHEVIGGTYIAQMDGEDGPLVFVMKHTTGRDRTGDCPPFPDAFHVTLTDEQLMEVSRAADGNEFAASPQEGDEVVDETFTREHEYVVDGIAKALNADLKHQLVIVTYDDLSQFWVAVLQPYPNRVFGGGEVAYCGAKGDGDVWYFTRIGPNLEFPTSIKLAAMGE